MYDIVIIGSGPAGLSAALAASGSGLEYLTLERGVICDTIYRFPIAKHLFSTADEIELESGEFAPKEKPTREQLLTHYTNIVVRNQLNVATGSDVLSIARDGGGFRIDSTTGDYFARTVLVATGGFGRQRKLGARGESDEKVSYHFSEAYPYALKDILVAGGGNSAAEAAIWLAEVGARVTLAVRRDSLDVDPSEAPSDRALIKPWVRAPLDAAIEDGRIRLITSATVAEINGRAVLLALQPSGQAGQTGRGYPVIEEVICDHIFALIGADPDTSLLEGAHAGIAADGRPVYDPESFETTVPGLYVAGRLTRELHIKNAIKAGRIVIERVAAQVLTGCLT
ncbi:MAG TPA: NAD(P)-binding domain-containing protein [Blastocatellia bacterium]|nr:NAD(P)-binding domain-containing protein [Blastocatellia bacterium]